MTRVPHTGTPCPVDDDARAWCREECPQCGKPFADRERVYHHIYNAHGKKAAKAYKPEYPVGDTEAEWIISGMIGERT